MKRFDPKWQLRRCVNCGHEERFPALCPLEALCSECHGRWGAGGGRTMHIILCLCGCNTVLENLRRRDTLYAARSCSTRAWKARVSYDERRATERAQKASPTRHVLSPGVRPGWEGAEVEIVRPYGEKLLVRRVGTDDTELVRAEMVVEVRA